MATKTVYAVIAVVIIAIVAIGAALVLSNGDEGIKGEYTLQQGSYVALEGGIATTGEVTPAAMTIKSDDNGIVTAVWGESSLVGERYDGYMRFAGVYNASDGHSYQQNIYAYVENGVLRFTELMVSEDYSITKAVYCVFAKEGAVVPNDSHTPIFKEGTAFEAFDTVYSVDGEVKDVKSICKMEVEKYYGFAYLIDSSMAIGSTVIDCKSLAIRTDANVLLMGYGPVTGFSNIFTDGEKAEVHFNFTKDDSTIVIVSRMTSTDLYEVKTPSEFAGKVYSGTSTAIVDDGTKYIESVSVSFGDDANGIFGMYETYGEMGYMNQATIVKDHVGGGYYIASYDSYYDDGRWANDTIKGYITADMSKMYLSYVTFYSDGTAEYSKSELTLTDGVSIIGTYDFRSGTEAFMTYPYDYYFDNLDTSGGYDKFAITYYDGMLAVAKWGPDTMYGSVNNGKITFAGKFTYGKEAFITNGFADIKDGIITYSSVGINQDDTVSYASASVMTKSGLDIAVPKIKNNLDIGTKYEPKRIDLTIDGESIEVKDVGLVTQVFCESGGIVVIEDAYKVDGADMADLYFAVNAGSNSLKAVFADERRFADIFAEKDLMIVNTNFVKGGHNIVASHMMVKGDNVPSVTIPDFTGLVYSGISGIVGANTQTYQGVSIVFGEYSHDHILATLTVGDLSIPVTFQIVIKEGCDSYGVRTQAQYTYNGHGVISVYKGTISKDLKTFNLIGAYYSEKGTIYAYKSMCTLVEDDTGAVGCYSLTLMDHISGTDTKHYEVDNPYGYYFTVTSIDDVVVSGTFFGKKYIGFMNDIRMQFRIAEDNLVEYAEVFFYDGSCVINSYGVYNGSPFANYFQLYKEGAKTIEERPAPMNIFKVGDSFTSYETTLVVDGVQKECDAGQVFECIASYGWLYAFKHTLSDGQTVIMNGCGTSVGLIKSAGLYKGEIATYNIMRLSDTLVSMDREFMRDGGNAVVTLKMTSDGSTPVTPAYKGLEGKVYSGTIKKYTIVDGMLIEIDLGQIDLAFTKTVGSITTAVRSDGTNDVKLMIVDPEGKLRAMESFSSFTMGSVHLDMAYVATVSDDLGKITQYGYGNTSDGTPEVLVMEYTLNKDSSVITTT